MVTATFRFHQVLGEFLPRDRRGRTFASACAHRATTKHMIEALGVPHTEVETVFVNREDSGFDRVLQEGDHVAVYARFELHGIGPHGGLAQGRLRDRPRARMRFVADSHLGGLARLLRMAGYGTLYDNHYHDDEVEDLAGREDRIVLTRDRELLKRRSIVHGCYIHAIEPAQQLRELFERLELAHGARPFSLCLHCDAVLRAVDKACVIERLPPSVRAQHDSFTTCETCQRVYWKGSHHKRMAQFLADLARSKDGALDDCAGVESAGPADVSGDYSS